MRPRRRRLPDGFEHPPALNFARFADANMLAEDFRRRAAPRQGTEKGEDGTLGLVPDVAFLADLPRASPTQSLESGITPEKCQIF